VPEQEQKDPRDLIETWELNGDGTVYVYTYNPRDRVYGKTKVSSTSGSRRLRISVEDRRYNEEQIIEEMQQHNPFRNGLLRLVSAEKADDIDATYHLTSDDLRELLAVRDEDDFRDGVEGIHSELMVRRLKQVAEDEGTMRQNEIVREIIEARYKVGGTQKTVQEMIDEGEKLGGERLSG
jgi:hypothetical protein